MEKPWSDRISRELRLMCRESHHPIETPANRSRALSKFQKMLLLFLPAVRETLCGSVSSRRTLSLCVLLPLSVSSPPPTPLPPSPARGNRTSNSSATLSSCVSMEPCACPEESMFTALSHADATFRKMEGYLRSRQLCDVTLVAGERRIPAHR